MVGFHLPRDDQRAVLLGKTGSGKTQAGIWQLSERLSMTPGAIPWYVLDFKRDRLINKIPYIQETTFDQAISDQPGLFIIHPLPDEIEKTDEFLMKIWNHENVGVYVDEGYMLGNSNAFNSLLTQGRSKKIPLIVLSQKPVWISRFVFSEADYIQYFFLQDERDRKTVQSFMPYDLEKRLPTYYSVWYDIGADETFVLKPVPPEKQILERFRSKLEPSVPAETAQRNTRRFRVI